MSKQKGIFIVAILVPIFLSGSFVQLLTNTRTENPYINGIISSIKKNSFIEASGQYGGGSTGVSISVPEYTTNHTPTITGTCVIGDNLNFTVKYGDSYQNTSYTFQRACTATNYSYPITNYLPDGKYRVDVIATTPGSGGSF